MIYKRISKVSISSILYLLLLISAISLPAITTPCGTTVPNCQIRSEFSAPTIAALNARALEAHPKARILEDASNTYNCHAFAWHTSEGGSAIWLGTVSGSQSVYWTDGSYKETSRSSGAKIRYSGDHSGICVGSNDYVRSKWGSWPLMLHRATDCPSGYGSPSKYYTRSTLTTSIVGPTSMTTGSASSFSCSLSGGCNGSTSYQWYKMNSGSSSWTTLGTSSTQSTTMGSLSFTLKVRVTKGNGSAVEDTHYVSRLTPLSVTISGPTLMSFRETGSFSAHVYGGSGTTTYQWYKKMALDAPFYAVGTTSTQNITMYMEDMQVKVVISRNGQTAQRTITVHHQEDPIRPRVP